MKSIKIGGTNHLLQKTEGSSKVQEVFFKNKMNVVFMRNVNFILGNCSQNMRVLAGAVKNHMLRKLKEGNNSFGKRLTS